MKTRRAGRENKRGRARQEVWEIGEEGRETRNDRGRSSLVHLVRLMHRTGSSNGRVGHEYLINNYYRETLFLRGKRESGFPSPFRPRPRPSPITKRPKDPSVPPLFFNPVFSRSLTFFLFPLLSSQTSYLPNARAPCRHICIFIRECNRRARFSPLVVRCHGKNSRKMVERFVVDMRSDFLLHSLPSPFPACRKPSPLRNVSSTAADLEETIVGLLRDPELWRSTEADE